MNELFEIIPEGFFTKDLRKNGLGSIKLAILREVTGNLIIRNNYPDETTTFRISDEKDVVEIAARKFKSKEKLLGLKICRDQSAVDTEVRYNVIAKPEQLANPNSVLFGDSVTVQNDAAALPSRVIYDWAYSIRDVSEITGTLQHNALDENGTMYDENKGELRQSLFSIQYVKPGTLFPHFITFENVTPELFLHAVACILFEKRYGAQSTTLSPTNLNNHILGIGFAKFEQPVNSYLIAKNWNNDQAVSFENVVDTINDHMKAAYRDNYVAGSPLVELIDSLWADEQKLKAMYAKSQEECVKFLKAIKIIKDKKSKV